MITYYYLPLGCDSDENKWIPCICYVADLPAVLQVIGPLNQQPAAPDYAGGGLRAAGFSHDKPHLFPIA